MTTTNRAVRIALASLTLTTAAAAQNWRTVNVSRQLRDSAQHQLHVEYGAGKLDVRATREPVLFDMQLRYNDTNGEPMHRYDAGQRSLQLGINGQSIRVGKHMSDETSGEMHLALSRSVPFDLQLDVGAAKAELDLGGLMLTDARIHAGASDMTLSFSTPNVARLKSLNIDVGAAGFAARGLANANTSSVRLEGGVGDISLAFDGDWTQNIELDATVAVGKLTVRAPERIGLRVDVKRVLAGFDHVGLDKRADGAYYSSNWDTATYRLTIHAETVIGAIAIDRTLK